MSTQYLKYNLADNHFQKDLFSFFEAFNPEFHPSDENFDPLSPISLIFVVFAVVIDFWPPHKRALLAFGLF